MRATLVASLVLMGTACNPTADHKASGESSIPSSTAATSVVAETATVDRSAVVAVAAAERVRAGNAAISKSRINVVERFGHFTPDGFVAPDSGGDLIDDQTRAAVEHALSPGVVTWVDSVDSVTNRGAGGRSGRARGRRRGSSRDAFGRIIDGVDAFGAVRSTDFAYRKA
jgi:peptidoglycan/xylan/chitin deacetylase (PgdA/CDA1 family)